MKTTTSLAVIVSALWGLSAHAQNTLQFTATRVTDEGAIHLEWASQSNHTYQIQCTDALNTNDDGTTTWTTLYNDYPSQGTNTFWLDTGNYFLTPAIVHPSKSTMRFYRILDLGLDDLASDEPAVSVVSPTNGSVISGLLTISVAASTDQGVVYNKLYIDGQEMWLSQDGTNYIINTCEFDNGPHVIFATANSTTQPDGPAGATGLTGHAVSAFVPVYFSNQVTRISFSQQFFEPSLGQTQVVSAVFADDCDWTLQIQDIASNVVKSASGSGTSMAFAWDGKDNSGSDLPNGVYYYYISATTNGETGSIVSGGGSSGTNTPPPPPSPSSLSGGDSSLWVILPDSETIVPLKIFPPGLDTNGLDVVEASTADILELSSLTSESGMSPAIGGGLSPNASAAPSAQSAPPAPLRPPDPPCRGSIGTIGVGWQMYNVNGTNPVYASPISDGSGITGHDVQIEGNGGNVSLPYAPFRYAALCADNFLTEMQKGCWKIGLLKNDEKLRPFDLQGNGPFNSVDIALLILHGAYGTSFDFTTGHQFKGIYFPIVLGGSAQYVRMSEMSLGGSSPTNGLKWAAMISCTSLYQQNWNSMKSQGVKPYNANMHMILGAGTDVADEPLIGRYWADNMLGNPNAQPSPVPPMKIRDAWYAAGEAAYAIGVSNGMGGYYPSPSVYAVAADGNCSEDSLQTNSLPSGSGVWSYYNSQQVFP